MKSVPLPAGRAGLRWGIYERISSRQGTKVGEDETDRISLETQDAEGRALIATLDPTGTIDERYVVREIHTGLELFPRRKLKHLRDGLAAGHINAIACYHPFRWTRDPEHAGYLATERRELGYILRFVLDDPGDDDAGALVSYITHWSGRQQHRQIVEQTSSNRRALVRQGRPWVGPKAPYGLRWRYDTRSRPDGSQVQYKVGWERQATEAAVLERLCDGVLAGRSIRRLATELMADNVPAPKGGPQWYPMTILRLLTERTYTGEAYALKLELDKNDTYVSQQGESAGRTRARVKERARDEWVRLPDGYAPVIIEPEKFEAVQRVLEGRPKGGRVPIDPEATLFGGGRTKCWTCKRVMTRRGKDQPLLRCPGGSAWNLCPARPSIAMATLDAEARRLVRAICADPSLLAERAAEHRASDPVARDVALVEQTLTELDQKWTSLTEALETVTHPDAARTLAEKLDQLAQRREASQTHLAELEAQRDGWRQQLAVLDRYVELAEEMSTELDRFTHAEWQEAVDAFGITAVVYPRGSTERYDLITRLEDVWPEGGLMYRSSRTALHQAPASSALVLSWPASHLAALPRTA